MHRHVKKLLALVLLLTSFAHAASFDAAKDLKLLMVGHQGGILKVFNPDKKGVAFFRGLDDRSTAPFDESERASLFAALRLSPERLQPAAADVMKRFARLPRKEATAFLGALASQPDFDSTAIRAHLVKTMNTDKDVAVRRQAILALAVADEVDAVTVDQVLTRYEKSQNLWETFPVQQFFEYHADALRSMDIASIRGRVAVVNSLYRANVLNSLGG